LAPAVKFLAIPLILSAFALASCGPSPKELARAEFNRRVTDCKSHATWERGSAYLQESCIASALFELMPRLGYGSASESILDYEHQRLVVAQKVDKGEISLVQAGLELGQARSVMRARAAEEAEVEAALRRRDASNAMLNAGARVLSANRPSTVTTTCNALTPDFASCTSTGY